jgi:ADP-ribose pyrophosphatase YjhB (NUDIX family)
VKLGYRLLYLGFRDLLSILRAITIGVRLMLVRDQTILLVQHSYQDQWHFPGGGVKSGETVEQAARREAQEELGLSLGPLSLFGIFTNFSEGRTDHVVVFVCTSFSDPGGSQSGPAAEPAPSVEEALARGEIERAVFFPLDALPADLSPGGKQRIAEFLAGGKPQAAIW